MIARGAHRRRLQGFLVVAATLSLPLDVSFSVSACRSETQSGRASPSARTERTLVVRVPAALLVTRALDALDVGVDPAALASLPLEVKEGMALGVESETFAFARGQGRPSEGQKRVYVGENFEQVRAVWTSRQNGIPMEDVKYVVEMNLVLFETDAPPTLPWDPHAGHYTALFARTLRQSEE